MEVNRIGDWMQTYTGRQFWPLDPRPEEIYLEDIAHALSNQCRFAGHCTTFYSVAQHSVLISRIVPSIDRAWGLLHDAAEAYLVDLPRPIKHHSEIGTEYRKVEAQLMAAIAIRFDLPFDLPLSVRAADDILLVTEKRDLMPNSPAKWRETSEPMPELITGWIPVMAKNSFLHAAARLGIE